MWRASPRSFLKLYAFIAGLGEFKIRDLNDEINKLLREKGQWEVRIKQLGGPDFLVFSKFVYTATGFDKQNAFLNLAEIPTSMVQ